MNERLQYACDEHGWCDFSPCPKCKPKSELPAPAGSAPPSELVLFVRRQITHKIGRHTFSREWSEGQIHDAANMISDYMAQNEKGQR